MNDYQLVTLFMFMQSYDRDVLYLQDDPTSYIADLEVELSGKYPGGSAFDRYGNLVWPLGILKEHTGVIEGQPIWGMNHPS
jgi:hypothetical protein